MSKKLMSLLLALCYLSVSLTAFSVHSHDHGDRLAHSCAACAWHSESVTDVPAGPISVVVPVITVAAVTEPGVQISSISSRTFSDRGPPYHS